MPSALEDPVPRRPFLGILTTLVIVLASLVAAPAAVAADRDCGDFASQRAAQIFFLNHGGPQSDPHRLDSDGDGIACESNPAPTYYGTTPPGGGGGTPDPEPQITTVRSQVHLVLAPRKRIAGESFRMKIRVRPAISRTVMVQRKVNGRWKDFGSGVTSANGKTSSAFKAPRAKVSYRAVVESVTKGNKKYTAATSRARSLSVQRQRVALSFNRRVVGEGEQVRASVRATPVRAGRTIVLQMRSAGSWRAVRTSAVDRRGRATFTITPALGRANYRAVALRHRGARPVQSATKQLTATDVTPPRAPFDLVAVPGDGAVELSWSRVVPKDFAHHEVWVRTAGTSWSLVKKTDSDHVTVSLLPNGVVHWFAVTSVDTSGNESARSSQVAATPTAPDPED
ncbi:MAG: excalibur calcium-binding domain-containing protein [Nocardioides sp.]